MTSALRFRPPRVLRPTLIGFLIAGMVLNGLYALTSLVVGLVYPDFYDIDAPFARGEEAMTYAGVFLVLISVPVFIATVVLFCCWIFRANKNAQALGVTDMPISAGWSVGWWFIPIANLFKPYQATKEIYQASDPDYGLDDWRSAPVPATLRWWWAAWLIGNFVGEIDGRMGASANPQIAHVSSWTGLASGLLSLIAAVLVIRIIQEIDNRQLVKATESMEAPQRFCLTCNYDLSGSHGQLACPECGTTVPRSITATTAML